VLLIVFLAHAQHACHYMLHFIRLIHKLSIKDRFGSLLVLQVSSLYECLGVDSMEEGVFIANLLSLLICVVSIAKLNEVLTSPWSEVFEQLEYHFHRSAVHGPNLDIHVHIASPRSTVDSLLQGNICSKFIYRNPCVIEVPEFHETPLKEFA
jgi:hypothetical protein